MRKYVYQCDACEKILSMPDDPKQATEHLNVKSANLFFSYYSKKWKKWKQEKFILPGRECHFCNGKCMGRYVDRKVGEIIKRIKKGE